VTRYVVLDTETTGTVPERDRVVWVAVAVLHDGTVVERWSTRLDPGPASRARAGGIDLSGQPRFTDVAPRLTGLVRGGVLVAHNAPFNVSFLTAEYERAGLAIPKLRVICTLRLAHRLGLDVASLSLVDCCAHFGISHQRRHRADEDVGSFSSRGTAVGGDRHPALMVAGELLAGLEDAIHGGHRAGPLVAAHGGAAKDGRRSGPQRYRTDLR
jgi:DNA polymerase III alpha subunit (gram-positive type)